MKSKKLNEEKEILQNLQKYKEEITEMKSEKLNNEKKILLNLQKYKEEVTKMKSKKLNKEEQILSKNGHDLKKVEQTEDKAINHNNEEQLKNLVVSTGNSLSELKSLIKCIDTVIDDEMYFKSNDIENLIIILKNMIDKTSEQFEKIEKYLNI